MRHSRLALAGIAALLAVAGHAAAQDAAAAAGSQNPTPAAAEPMTVEMKALDGSSRGTVRIVPTPNGLLFEANLSGFGAGESERVHAFHVHEVGKCEGDFTSAGGHYNPTGKAHGYLAENGPHAGDLPNFVLASDGTARFNSFGPVLAMTGGAAPLNDADGSAIMVHGGADDYKSQPSGDAGSRVACGVVFRAP